MSRLRFSYGLTDKEAVAQPDFEYQEPLTYTQIAIGAGRQIYTTSASLCADPDLKNGLKYRQKRHFGPGVTNSSGISSI